MRSIQSIIFVRLLFVIVIFVSVVSAGAYFLTKDAINQFVISDAATSLSFIISNIETNYKSDLMSLDDVATMDGFLPFEEKKAREQIQDFLEFPSIFNTIHMYRADGPLIFAERRATMGPYAVKPNFYLKEAEFISLAKKVIETKQPMASQVFTSKKGTLFQTYVTPIFDDLKKEHVYGILSGGVFPRLQRIDYLLHGLNMGPGNFILITDSYGHFITSDGIAESDAAKSLAAHTGNAAAQFFANSQEKPLIEDKVSVGPRSCIVMSLPIKQLQLIVTMGVNRQRMDDKVKQLSYRLLGALSLGLLLSVAASIFIGERLAKPFRQIASAVNDIDRGIYTVRVPYAGDDEIGYLSRTINTLAEKIEKSEYLGDLWSAETGIEEIVKAESTESTEAQG